MVSDSNAITGGFVGLFVGLLIVLVGVFIGGNLAVIAVGGVIGVISIGGFALAAFGSESGSIHETES